ncbi:MAG TPA: ABC transporter ATP-binding protein [Candidatus Enterocloster faecavium]|uniref:ABC transporter ATP-binding protein n=1 Tax=Candidatus Enterocloster faecavium TaxID=2838560 RepID=A0A9D2L7R5_9FIRM|nr:ABC transporter ATP-binding protein [Candidatus Enterocloster faecavium]
MSSITLKHIHKAYGKDVIIPDLNFTIEDNSFTVLVGPSGCGKSTTLRMIAGLEKPTSGEILIDDQNVVDVAPGKRGIAMVFQNYALYPTMSVRDNIEFGLKNKKVPKEERNKLIQDVCEIVGLTPYLSRKPSELSGGQRQRVALARAMVKNPKVFLMDEPLSNLDAKLRQQMRVELIELHKRLKATFIYVTHDQVEAMSMGDNIILMDKGVIMQRSTPKEMYHNPQNAYTAQFIGTPPMNILDTMVPDAKIGFRPEKTALIDPGNALIQIKGRIVTKEQLGAEMNYSIETAYGKIMVKTEDDIDGENCRIFVKEEHIFAFAPDGSRIPVTDQMKEGLRNLEKGA